MTIIREYANGNCVVTLHGDGTKVRTWEGEAEPAFPESIDLKVTNRCARGCPHCHEESVPDGLHASPGAIERIVDGLPPGVEIAIGGGNPLEHPEIVGIVRSLNARGLIPNMTINAESLLADYVAGGVFARMHPYLFGVGVSGMGCLDMLAQLSPKYASPNIVVHAIAGIHKPLDFVHTKKLLILGYKRHGRGVQYYGPAIERNIAEWRYWLPARMSRGGVTSFDNLALEQLRVRELIGEDEWRQRFMGHDGQFTMYVDAVRNQYAVSSVSRRTPLDGMSAREAFTMMSIKE